MSSGRFDNDRFQTTRVSLFRLISAAPALLLLSTTIAQAQTALERARRDEVSTVPTGDPAMEAAFARARATLEEFLAVLAAPPPGTRAHAVKIRVADGKAVEYFWLNNLKRDGDRFTGQINNTPRLVSNVKFGQVMRFTRAEIYDWMYQDVPRRRLMGNFTACALLTHEKPAQAAEVKRELGLVCD